CWFEHGRLCLTCANEVDFAENSLIPNARDLFLIMLSHARHPEGEFNEREGSRWMALGGARAKRSSRGDRPMDCVRQSTPKAFHTKAKGRAAHPGIVSAN